MTIFIFYELDLMSFVSLAIDRFKCVRFDRILSKTYNPYSPTTRVQHPILRTVVGISQKIHTNEVRDDFRLKMWIQIRVSLKVHVEAYYIAKNHMYQNVRPLS